MLIHSRVTPVYTGTVNVISKDHVQLYSFFKAYTPFIFREHSLLIHNFTLLTFKNKEDLL